MHFIGAVRAPFLHSIINTIQNTIVKLTLIRYSLFTFLTAVSFMGAAAYGQVAEQRESKAQTQTPKKASPALQVAKSGVQTAPNWMMRTSQGEDIELYTELEKGHTVVMIFWASWCRFCHKLLPILAAERRNQNSGIGSDKAKVYTFNIWENADPTMYLKRQGVTLPMVPEADRLARRFGIRATPGVVVISPDRSMQKIKRKGRSAERLVQRISAAIQN